MTLRHASALALLSAVGLLSVAGVARAQATVVVTVHARDGGAAEARVTLTPEGDGAPQSCQTEGGTCRIAAVLSGRYVVSAMPLSEGRAPIPRPVLIPPSGDVTISVTLR